MGRRQNPLRALSGGVFLIFLAIAFAVSQGAGHLFLPLLFVGLAFSALFGSFSTLNPRGVYGGIQGFVWMLGLALCFLLGFWPWILVVVGVSAVLGALSGPIIAALVGMGIMGVASMMNRPPQSYQQPYQPPQQPYQPYQQGYQPPQGQPAQETYQEGGRQYSYPEQYEQPQAQYPREMPSQQQ